MKETIQERNTYILRSFKIKTLLRTQYIFCHTLKIITRTFTLAINIHNNADRFLKYIFCISMHNTLYQINVYSQTRIFQLDMSFKLYY